MIDILAEIDGKDARGRFTCGIVLRDDKVIEAAPKLKWVKGWTRDAVRAYCRDRGWSVSVVTITES